MIFLFFLIYISDGEIIFINSRKEGNWYGLSFWRFNAVYHRSNMVETRSESSRCVAGVRTSRQRERQSFFRHLQEPWHHRRPAWWLPDDHSPRLWQYRNGSRYPVDGLGRRDHHARDDRRVRRPLVQNLPTQRQKDHQTLFPCRDGCGDRQFWKSIEKAQARRCGDHAQRNLDWRHERHRQSDQASEEI